MSNDITGSVKVKPNLSLITDSSGCITDLCFDYYNSKYQFSDFKNIVLMDSKNPVELKEFDRSPKYSEYYRQDKVGVEQAYVLLISLYTDLDKNLTRLLEGYNDPLFIRFVCKSGVFRTEYHWQMLMRNWNRGFSLAIARYYNGAHKNYVPTGISYVAYFDMFFSNYLYYAIGRSDQHLAEDSDVDLRTNEQIHYDYLYNESEASLKFL